MNKRRSNIYQISRRNRSVVDELGGWETDTFRQVIRKILDCAVEPPIRSKARLAH